MSDFGCPNTEQITHKSSFEAHFLSVGLNFSMRKDAPHYDNNKTRIAYFQYTKDHK